MVMVTEAGRPAHHGQYDSLVWNPGLYETTKPELSTNDFFSGLDMDVRCQLLRVFAAMILCNLESEPRQTLYSKLVFLFG